MLREIAAVLIFPVFIPKREFSFHKFHLQFPLYTKSRNKIWNCFLSWVVELHCIRSTSFCKHCGLMHKVLLQIGFSFATTRKLRTQSTIPPASGIWRQQNVVHKLVLMILLSPVEGLFDEIKKEKSKPAAATVEDWQYISRCFKIIIINMEMFGRWTIHSSDWRYTSSRVS